MAANRTYYAWTNILTSPSVDPDSKTIIQPHPRISAGEEVNASKLGVSKEEFDALIKHGVVRTAKYPTTSKYESPKQALLSKARRDLEIAEAGGVIDDPDEFDDIGSKPATDDK